LWVEEKIREKRVLERREEERALRLLREKNENNFLDTKDAYKKEKKRK